jgi:hypothetical protein
MWEKLAQTLPCHLPEASVENPEQLRPCMVPHVKAVSRPLGRWPKASLYVGMMHDPRSSPGAAADTLPTFIGKKLRIHTGANSEYG